MKKRSCASLLIFILSLNMLTGCSASSVEELFRTSGRTQSSAEESYKDSVSGSSYGDSSETETGSGSVSRADSDRDDPDSADSGAADSGTSSGSNSLIGGLIDDLLRTDSEREQAEAESRLGEPVEETEDLSGFAYDQLNEDEKSAYASLYTGIAGHESSFVIRAADSEDIKTALRAILTDHPEFFWLTGSAQMTGYSTFRIWRVDLDFNVDGSEIDSISERIESKVHDFLASVPDDATNYTRVRMAYEYIISNTDYDADSSQNQNIQSVFLNGLSVCAGYSKAFKYLCDRMSIPCIYVEGTVTRGGSSSDHAWNIVQIDGIYTCVDTSWGDPTYDEDETDSGHLDIIYDDLCLTTEEMERNYHVEDDTWDYPECADRSWDYYILNGYYHEGYDRDEIESVLWNAVNEGGSVVLMKFSDADSYEQAMSALFPDDGSDSLLREPLQQRMKWDSASSMQYYYSYSDELYIIKIYW